MTVFRRYITKMLIIQLLFLLFMGGIVALLWWLSTMGTDATLSPTVRVITALFVVVQAFMLLRTLVPCLRCMRRLGPQGMQWLDWEYPGGMKLGSVTATDHYVVDTHTGRLKVIPTSDILSVTSLSAQSGPSGATYGLYGGPGNAGAYNRGLHNRGFLVVTRDLKKHSFDLSAKKAYLHADEMIRFIHARKPQFPLGGPAPPPGAPR